MFLCDNGFVPHYGGVVPQYNSGQYCHSACANIMGFDYSEDIVIFERDFVEAERQPAA